MVVTLALVPGGLSASAQARATSSTSAVEGLLVFTVPHLTWDALERADTPNLDALLADGEVANLSVRVKRRQARLGESYATIGAGTRAVAPDEVAGLALSPDEPYERGTAADAFRRRTGNELDGASGHLALAELKAANDAELFDGEVGALGRLLDEAGVRRAVIANADHAVDGAATPEYHREAVAALMTTDGQVPLGRVDRGLVVDDATAATGTRLDSDVVEESFEAAWGGRAAVLVEASDLVRVNATASSATARQRESLTERAVSDADRLLGRLLTYVDLERDAVMVLAPASPTGEARLTVAGLRAPGRAAGLMLSGQTRRAGFVTISDVAPTVLDLFGLDVPASMEGRPFEFGRTGGDYDDRLNFLTDTERDARFRDRMVGPVTDTFIVVSLVLIAAALAVLRWGAGRSALEIGAFSLLGFLPATYLAGLASFSTLGPGLYWVATVGAGIAIGLAARSVSRLPLTSVGVALAVMVGVIVVSVVILGSRLQFSTVFGDSPIVAGRFTGINNVTFAQLAAGAIFLAAFAIHWRPGRQGRLAVPIILGGVVLVDGLPMFGADIGGVLTAVPAFAYTASLLLGVRVRLRSAIVWVAATVGVVLMLGLVDLTRSTSERSHLGRLFERLVGDGWDGLVVVVLRKADQNLNALTDQLWTLFVPAAAGFVVWLARPSGALRPVLAAVPELGMAGRGLLVAAVLGFALNDSGIAVPGMMLAVTDAVLVILVLRLGPGRDRAPIVRDRVAVPSGDT